MNTLVKSHNKSWFERFHNDSKFRKDLFDSKQTILDEKVVVLQIAVDGNFYVCEIVKKEDYE